MTVRNITDFPRNISWNIPPCIHLPYLLLIIWSSVFCCVIIEVFTRPPLHLVTDTFRCHIPLIINLSLILSLWCYQFSLQCVYIATTLNTLPQSYPRSPLLSLRNEQLLVMDIVNILLWYHKGYNIPLYYRYLL